MEPSIESELPQFSVLDVRFHNAARRHAIARLEAIIRRRSGRATSVFFVNAHTLNLAAGNASYRETLNAGDFVLADGTGVRWAARLQGVRVAENMVGTDFVPEMFQSTAGRGYSYFMLGADAATIARGRRLRRRGRFRAGGWPAGTTAILPPSRSFRPRWPRSTPPDRTCCWWAWAIRSRNSGSASGCRGLTCRLCLGIGGLFDYWAGNVSRRRAACDGSATSGFGGSCNSRV